MSGGPAPEPGIIEHSAGLDPDAVVEGLSTVASDEDDLPAPATTRGRGRSVLYALLAVGLATILAVAWFSRPGPSSESTAASSSASAPSPARALQPGATYVATTQSESGGTPSCDVAAATWTTAADGAIVTTVSVAGPTLVSVVAQDKEHPERPNTSHGSAQVARGKTAVSVTVPAPTGGVGRVLVGIQGEQGTQQCLAGRAA